MCNLFVKGICSTLLVAIVAVNSVTAQVKPKKPAAKKQVTSNGNPFGMQLIIMVT